MTALALALSLASATPTTSPQPTWYRVWRIVETDTLHVGLRPAVYATSEESERALGVTVQVTVFAL